MNVMGLDVSTVTGWVVLGDDGTYSWGEVSFKKLTGWARVMAFEDAFKSLLAIHAPALVTIEGYGYANAHSLATLVEIGTVVRRQVFTLGYKWIDIPPNSLKKFVTGSGAAKKEQMMLEVYKRWGFETKSNNVADAYGLARMAESWMLMSDQERPKFQQAILDKLVLAV